MKFFYNHFISKKQALIITYNKSFSMNIEIISECKVSEIILN